MAGRRQGDVEAVWANTSLANKHFAMGRQEVPVEENIGPCLGLGEKNT